MYQIMYIKPGMQFLSIAGMLISAQKKYHPFSVIRHSKAVKWDSLQNIIWTVILNKSLIESSPKSSRSYYHIIFFFLTQTLHYMTIIVNTSEDVSLIHIIDRLQYHMIHLDYIYFDIFSLASRRMHYLIWLPLRAI